MRTLSAAIFAAVAFLGPYAGEAAAQDADVAGCFNQSLDAETRIEHCTAALRRYPHLSGEPKAALLMRRAVAFIQIGNHRQALGDLTVAIGTKPGDPVLHLMRGQVLGHLGRLPQALEDANRAVALAPHLPDPYTLRGEILERLGRRPQALADFRRALAIDPDNARAAAGAARLGGTGGRPAPANPGGGTAGGGPSGGPGSLTVRVQKNMSGTLHFALYSQGRQFAWPSWGRNYQIVDGTVFVLRIGCQPDEKICYGAWTVDGGGDVETTWGVGVQNRESCQNCCFTCNGGDTGLLRFVRN